MHAPVGLMVVHGIGDPMPGETLRDFTDTLEARGVVHFTNHVEDHRLVDEPASRPDKLVFFPAHLRHGVARDGGPLIAAEVFWGSASRLAPGRLGVLQGIVSILVDIPSLVHAAHVARSPLATRVVYRLCALLSMVLAGLAFALNAVLLTAFILTAAAEYSGIPVGDAGQIAVPVLASALVAAFGFVPWLRFIETRAAMWGAGACCLVLAWLTAPILSLQTFGDAAALLLVIVVGVAAALLLLAVLVYVVGQWLVAGRHRSTETSLLAAFIQFAAWTLIVPLTWRAAFELAPPRLLADDSWISDLYLRTAPADGLQWILLGIVALVAVAVAIERLVHARRQDPVLHSDPRAAVPSPRLIVNWQIGLTVAVATTLGAVAVIATTVDHALAQESWFGAMLWYIPQAPWTIVAIALVSYAFEPIRAGLDLVNDIVTYLYYRCDSGPARAWTRSAPVKTEDPTRFRFRSVLGYLVHDQGVRHLIVVAHSQGTIIALDELKAWTGDLPPVTLVTCGSPASHLYQFYFPDLCHDFRDPSWQPLFARLGRWVNLYRLSDYVGTTVERPPLVNFDQWAIAQGGHIGYWTHPAFADAIKQAGVF